MTGGKDLTMAEKEKSNAVNADEEKDRTVFKRDEDGILWCYDSAGNKTGRIFEHGID